MDKKRVMHEWERAWKDYEGLNIIARTYFGFVKSHVKEIINDIPIQSKVIDVGCGSGRSLLWLEEFGFNPIGIDCSKSSIRHCKNIGLDVSLMDAFKTTFKNKEFDLVFSEGLIEHFIPKDFQSLVNEMCRISKKYVLLVQPNRLSLFRKLANIYYLFIQEKGPPEQYYELEDFIRSFSINAFYPIRISITPLDGFWVLLFKRFKRMK